jgi:hypothetical protein
MMTIFPKKKLGLVSANLSGFCTSDLNDTFQFRRLASAADRTKLLCKTVIRSFFKFLNVSASPTLPANPTKYPGISVVFEK